VRNRLTELLENYPDREHKEIIDFGCGPGNAIPFIDGFKRVYAVDFSENMLDKARERFASSEQVEFICGDLAHTHIKAVDVILAVSSVMPLSPQEFQDIIRNFLSNLKEDGEIIMVLPSFESNSFLHQLVVDDMASQGASAEEVINALIKRQIDDNYSPLGYIRSTSGMIQKHWLKEEIEYRLSPFGFQSIDIEKLELEWGSQYLNYDQLKSYPKQWYWMVRIKR
jgi:trans-aconitate methyltransferase